MDSLTQLALGAAVGEMALGKRIGNKAPALGAAVATLPDLDYLVGMLLPEIDQLTFHRGYSHSLLFVTLLAPMLGYLLHRFFRGDAVSWRDWTLMSFLALLTAILLDAFTTYGVQLFLPFSNYAVSISSIAVIDPLYTLPLLIGAIAALFLRRDSRARRIVNTAALSVSSLYLGMTLVTKGYVESAFTQQLAEQGLIHQRFFVKPTLFNNVLWRGIAEGDDGYWVGFFSLLDDNRAIRFRYFAKNHHLLDGLEGERAVQRLIWVSNGYFQVSERNGARYVHDLRFGTGFEWLQDEREFVFSYRLSPSAAGPMGIERVALRVRSERDRKTFHALLARMRGID